MAFASEPKKKISDKLAACVCDELDYKNPELLKQFLTERGKILPGRMTGMCAKCQRKLALEIRRARMIALLPFAAGTE